MYAMMGLVLPSLIWCRWLVGVIRSFKYSTKDDLSHLHAFALKRSGAVYFSNPEFMKSNTKETAKKDEFWIVDNQLTFNKMQVLADSFAF